MKVLDANFLIDYLDGKEATREFYEASGGEAERWVIPVPAYAEALAGEGNLPDGDVEGTRAALAWAEPHAVDGHTALLAVHHEFVQTTGDDETTTLTEATERAASNGASQDGVGEGAGVDESAPVQPVGPNSGLRRKFGQDQPSVNDPALDAALHGLPPGEIPEPVPRTIDEVAGPGVDLSDSDILKRATASKSGETIQALLDGDSSL